MWFAIVGKRTDHGHARADAIAGGEARAPEEEDLVVLQAIRLDELGNRARPVVELDRARVGHLAATSRIERRVAQLREEPTLLERFERADLREDVRLREADELRREVGAPREVGRVLQLARAARARHLAVALHLDSVAVDVDRLTALLRQLDRQLDREAVGRGERERLLAGDRGIRPELLEQLEPALERLEEPLLLEPQHTRDLVGVRRQLGVRLAHLLDDDRGQPMNVARARSAAPAARRAG